MKNLCFLVVTLYFITGMYIFAAGCQKTDTLPVIQRGIADELLRFHVIGNSDSDDDQYVKLLVKNEIIEYLKPFLSDASSKSEAEEIILNHMNGIVETAQKKLNESGFYYQASASLSPSYFPIKVYGDISLPAGVYDSLLVYLGEAKGKNWWCIMFPQLCFVDSSYSIVPEASKANLKYLLTDEEYEAILNTPPKIEYKFKISEWFKGVF